jgi:hypothetical protein
MEIVLWIVMICWAAWMTGNFFFLQKIAEVHTEMIGALSARCDEQSARMDSIVTWIDYTGAKVDKMLEVHDDQPVV